MERQLEADGHATPGQIGQGPHIGTVDASRPLLAQGATGRIGGTGDEQDDDVGVEANEVKPELSRMGGAMAAFLVTKMGRAPEKPPRFIKNPSCSASSSLRENRLQTGPYINQGKRI